jgi:hypothetical protein
MIPEKFQAILYSHPNIERPKNFFKKYLEKLMPQLEKEIFSLDKPYTQLNYSEEDGITAYFGLNITKENLAIITILLRHMKFDILNTRAFKQSDGTIVITIGSI